MYNKLFVILYSTILFWGFSCTKDTVAPDVFGDIEGEVINADTQEPVYRANITTTPATNAIFSEEDGTFVLEDVPTGNYSIQARKKGFSNTSVNVSVRESRASTARISMNPVNENSVASEEEFEANVVNWFNSTSGDSSFVDVEYRISNTGDTADIDEYEVYFEVLTDQNTFYKEVSGTDLKKGQSRYGEFSRYIQQFTATDVNVSGIWISE